MPGHFSNSIQADRAASAERPDEATRLEVEANV